MWTTRLHSLWTLLNRLVFDVWHDHFIFQSSNLITIMVSISIWYSQSDLEIWCLKRLKRIQKYPINMLLNDKYAFYWESILQERCFSFVFFQLCLVSRLIWYNQHLIINDRCTMRTRVAPSIVLPRSIYNSVTLVGSSYLSIALPHPFNCTWSRFDTNPLLTLDCRNTSNLHRFCQSKQFTSMNNIRNCFSSLFEYLFLKFIVT